MLSWSTEDPHSLVAGVKECETEQGMVEVQDSDAMECWQGAAHHAEFGRSRCKSPALFLGCAVMMPR